MKKIFAACACLLLLLSACGNNNGKIRPKLPPVESIEDTPNYILQGFTLRSSEKTTIRWEVSAKHAQVFELKKKIFGQGVVITYNQPDGHKSTLAGDKAVINTDTNSLVITGNVTGKASDGTLIKTDKLNWDDERELLYSKDMVTVYKDGAVLSGRGFESDAGFRNVVIKERVRLSAETGSDE